MKSNTGIFKQWELGNLRLANRLVRSATDETLATNEGAPTQRLVEILVELAQGEVGLIIAGTAYISREARWGNNTSGLHHDRLIGPLSRLCAAVHKNGGVIAAQLLHCGSTVNPATLPERDILWGPSALIDPVCGKRVTALSRRQILKIVEDYAKAAFRAKSAGFDAVQIHAAHGYLINQFLSKSRNRRKDPYGGSLSCRARILHEVYDAIRGKVGSGYPILIKLSAHDGFPGGMTPQDAAKVAASLDNMGIDAIEVSAGTPEGAAQGGWDHIIPAPFKEGSLLSYALQVKDSVKCPVISVEGWRTPAAIHNALQKLDAVSMSRPFIREPHLVKRWKNGDLSPAKCISCNQCLNLTLKTGLGCIFSKDQQASVTV